MRSMTTCVFNEIGDKFTTQFVPSVFYENTDLHISKA